MRTRCSLSVLCLAWLLAPSGLPAQGSSEQVIERWEAELQANQERLRRGEWETAAKSSRELVAQMVRGLLTGEGASKLLALAVAEQAVAESGLGNEAEAVWWWHVAQNLNPELRKSTLTAYGPAGVSLGKHRLRTAGEPSEGGILPPASQRPQPVERRMPLPPPGLVSARALADVEIEVLVLTDGRPVHPVLLSGSDRPGLAYVACESLRHWRFEPARQGRAPVAALYLARFSREWFQSTAGLRTGATRSWESIQEERKRLELQWEQLDTQLRRGEWQTAYKPVRELVDRLQGEFVSDLLTKATVGLALAEAGLGRERDAIWHWQVAQNLSPGYELDAAAYGLVGQLLVRHKLRRVDEAPAGLAVETATREESWTPPRKLAGEEPIVQDSLAVIAAPKWVRLQAVIDENGWAVEPVVLEGRFSGMIFAVLEAVRTWRFEPARKGGRPVASLHEITVPPRADVPLPAIVPPTEGLGRVHQLLLKQRWAAARREARDLFAGLIEDLDPDRPQVAAALALVAVADAGQGDREIALCRWQVAQAIFPDLYHADLSGYGPAGAFLEENPWGDTEKADRVGTSKTADGLRTVTRPEKLSGSPPIYTERARAAHVTGVVIMEAIIAEDGWVRYPRVLQGLPAGLDLSALQTLCTWRFKPATLDGKPVKVYYTLTVSFSMK